METSVGIRPTTQDLQSDSNGGEDTKTPNLDCALSAGPPSISGGSVGCCHPLLRPKRLFALVRRLVLICHSQSSSTHVLAVRHSLPTYCGQSHWLSESMPCAGKCRPPSAWPPQPAWAPPPGCQPCLGSPLQRPTCTLWLIGSLHKVGLCPSAQRHAQVLAGMNKCWQG